MLFRARRRLAELLRRCAREGRGMKLPMKSTECEFRNRCAGGCASIPLARSSRYSTARARCGMPHLAPMLSHHHMRGGRRARIQMRARAVVPDSGVVWWRAQLRARREAADTAGRPYHPRSVSRVRLARSGLLGACFATTSTWFQWAFQVDYIPPGRLRCRTLFDSATAMSAQHGLLVLGAAAMLFLIPTAVILTLRRD